MYKPSVSFLLRIALCIVAITSCPIGSYGQELKQKGKITASYKKEIPIPVNRMTEDVNLPNWVAAALNRSITHLRRNTNMQNVTSELALRNAEQDNLAMTQVRLDQIKNEVPVFGGQLITHIDAKSGVRISGRVFKDAERVGTTPAISASEAIEKAKNVLAYQSRFEKQNASLMILPHEIIETRKNGSGATLVYLVELLILDGTENTARHYYFVNAKNGEIVWHYDNLQSQGGPVYNATGNTLYRGEVNFKTSIPPFTTSYFLADPTKSPGCTNTNEWAYWSRTMDSQNAYMTSVFLFDEDNVWHQPYQANDAHFGMSQTWDYYLNTYGRCGVNGSGLTLKMHVRYGMNYNNAFWNNEDSAFYGDGNGGAFSPLVSLDIVGHEIAHGLTQYTAGLIYLRESGGANESFSDIFGNAVESKFDEESGFEPDYLIGEESYTPGISGDALRYMHNPPQDGHSINHYSQYHSGINVHYSSGIQNNAFYLLAEGGTHPVSGITVQPISRVTAEAIFYRALTIYLFPSATFRDVRLATIQAANDLCGSSSGIPTKVGVAWDSVGVTAP